MSIPGMASRETKPLLKYDARIGRFKIDQREVNSITMIVDVENAEAGWLLFKEGAAPQFKDGAGQGAAGRHALPAMPDPNPESGWRRGFRCTVKLTDKIANGAASVREWASATLATTRAFDALHDQWLAAYKAHAGMVPVISCAEVKEVAGARGTNYLPMLTIPAGSKPRQICVSR